VQSASRACHHDSKSLHHREPLLRLDAFPPLEFTRHTKQPLHAAGSEQSVIFDAISQVFAFNPPVPDLYPATLPLSSHDLTQELSASSSLLRVGKCNGAFLSWHVIGSVRHSLICSQHANYEELAYNNDEMDDGAVAESVYLDWDVALGHHLQSVESANTLAMFAQRMRHDAPQAGLLLPWVMQNLSARAITCQHAHTCSMLRNVLPRRNVIDLSDYAKSPGIFAVRFRSILAPLQASKSLMDSGYPLGAYWYIDYFKPTRRKLHHTLLFLPRAENSNNDDTACPPVSETVPKSPNDAASSLWNECALRRAVRQWTESHGLEMIVLSHTDVKLSHVDLAREFERASYVVGVPGDLFAYIVHCSSDTKIFEINQPTPRNTPDDYRGPFSEIVHQDSYGTMALSMHLQYYRLPLQVSPENLGQLAALEIANIIHRLDSTSS
jgi:hypothetical protein